VLELPQGKKIKLYLKDNGTNYPVYKGFLIGVICLIITILLMALTLFVMLGILGFPAQD